MIKKKFAKGGAMLLSAALLATAILPNFPKVGTEMEAEAFQSATGVCTDHGGSYCKNTPDVYVDMLHDLTKLTYGTEEYNAALQQNIQVLHSTISADDNVCMQVFWAGIACWLSNNISSYGDMAEVQYWYNQATARYQQAESSEYVTTNDVGIWTGGNYTFPLVTEDDIGIMRHDGGATWNRLASQSPFLKGLGEYLFNPDSWEAKPQVWPQLSKKWFDSYSDYQTGETGYALWPVDSQQHALQSTSGTIVDPNVVASVALDMEVDDKYYYGASSGPLGPSGGSGSNKSNKYEIPMKEVFYFNCGYLNLYDQNTGTWIKTRTFDLPQSGDQSFVVNGGWAVSQRVVSNGTSDTGKTFGIDFEWVGPKDQETQLLMYFEIPMGSAPSVDSIVYNSPIEFVARFLRVTKCISCPSGRRPVTRHQTMIAYRKDDTPLFYPCFRLGGDDPNSEMHPGSEHFDVFSVEKTLEADYNLELEKYDYETGNPLEGARFELYERFDDQDQVLEEGSEKGQLYEKNFLNKPVKWDDFMVIGDLITNSQGKASFGSHKSYKYQATFCDGHPAPVFGGIDEVAGQSDPVDDAVVSPSVVPDANTEMEEAVQEDAAEIAQRWLDTVAACEECANGSAEHFHWLANEEVADALQQVIDGTMTPEDFNAQFEDATECVGKEEAFTSSGVKDDMEAVYQKFINLKYSYAVDEYQAVDGYALHGVHPDDVKLEIITTTASQTADGDEFSSFAGMYTSDDEFVVNEDAIAGYVPEDEESGDEDLEGDGGDEGDIGETESDEFALSDVNILPFTITAKASELSEDNTEIPDTEDEEKGFIEETKEFVEETWDSITSFFTDEDEQDGYDNVSEVGLLKDSVILFDDEFEIATPSDALYEVSLIDNAPAYISDPELGEPPEAGEGSGEGGLFPEAYEKATTGEFVLDIDTMEDLEINIGPEPSKHVSHVWIVYDHRTEGEIHFNKRDIDLVNAEDFDEYAIANGDGTLEGAVYGLFAAKDIVHPSKSDEVVYKQGEIVAMATTDRNGDGSFLVFTEKPGYVWSYEDGALIKDPNNPDFNGPANLYDNDDFKSEIDDYTEDGSDITRRIYSNNEQNNGNCWIGRPLILGDYYIKELSRSEGYELSVNGKDMDYTNFGADLDVVPDSHVGSVEIVENLYIQEQETLGLSNEIFFSVKSKDAYQNGGYDIVISHLPEGVEFYREDSTIKEGEFTYYEMVEKVTGEQAVATEEGIPRRAQGTGEITYKEEEATASLNKINVAKIKEYDDTEINKALNEVADDAAKLGENFKMVDNYDTGSIRFVKQMLEKALRAAKVNTPKGTSGYSTTDIPVYSRGIREGDTDRWNVSGAGAGQPATRTVYGPQIVKLTVKNATTKTNTAVLTELLQYYKDHPYWNFGGIDKAQLNGADVDFYVYAYNNSFVGDFAVLGESDSDNIIFKRVQFVPDDTTFEPYIVYVPYTNPKTGDSFGTYSDFKTETVYGATKVTAKITPNVLINGDGTLKPLMNRIPETYNIGEPMYDENGDPIYKTVMEQEERTGTSNGYCPNSTLIDARYEDGKYIIHVDVPFTDFFEAVQTDEEKELLLKFRAVVPKVEHTLTAEEAASAPRMYGYKDGTIVDSGRYEVEILKARADVYSDYEKQKDLINGTYIQYITLSYPGQDYSYQDGDGNPGMGTLSIPVSIMERPIRQKVKVVKDIQTMQDFDGYAHDTYSDVHTTNIEGKENDGSNKSIADWLIEFLTGEDQSPSRLPGFRFKAYLKSNLERLYRNESGDIIWTDRNGNAYVPTPKDTNGDGNYDTFTLVSGTEEIDFPEEHITSDGQRVSSNVQKLYTQVSHNTGSTTTGDISNNTWAEYNTPQGGNTSQVGELREDNTSLDGDNGEAVYTNGALYSYDGKNVNVKETDKINAEQNTGYTRLLETEVVLMEDGAGKTRNVETYNYEKFFDAMAAANTDKWDNDMFTTYDGDGMNNYPGQNWFETFDEKYQKDDRDPDHAPENVDGVDSDNTAGGDRDTSFKPFQWIREQLFGATDESKNDYLATHDNSNTENDINTSEEAKTNAKASDAVRQFAIKWYLDDEVAKLVKNNGYDEDVAIAGSENYQEEVYDLALYNALEKTYNYIRPFYNYDLDTIYSVEWDSAVDGGSDNDITTLSADTLSDDESYYYGASAYLPYGTYVVVEQQPYREDLDDFDNKNYKTDTPKEIILPTVYAEDGQMSNPKILNDYFNFDASASAETLLQKYYIRFNEEWPENSPGELNQYVIKAHSKDGDYEVYKYGLDVDKLTGDNYTGFNITQEQFDPLKDYYNAPLVDTEINGGNADSHYFADDANKDFQTASGKPYEENAIEKRYHYGSISENSGIADDVMYPNGPETDDNNPYGYYFKDDVKTMTGNQTAYDGKYASMLVPWSVVEPDDEISYNITNYTGYADSQMRNTFYTTKLRIEKLDSETGENIVHDDAIFSIYAASRYTSRDEIENAAKALDTNEREEFLELTEIGDVKFYLQDTQITGSYEFLTAMGARDITPAAKGRSAGVGELWTGIVSKGTPVCLEEEQIVMQDALGNKTGQFKVYATLNDIEMLNEDATSPDDKTYMDQNVGYVVTPQPLGAGVYVLVETKAPAGYVRSKPVAIEVYSDSVSYYANGLTNTKVDATIYQGNLITDK